MSCICARRFDSTHTGWASLPPHTPQATLCKTGFISTVAVAVAVAPKKKRDFVSLNMFTRVRIIDGGEGEGKMGEMGEDGAQIFKRHISYRLSAISYQYETKIVQKSKSNQNQFTNRRGSRFEAQLYSSSSISALAPSPSSSLPLTRAVVESR